MLNQGKNKTQEIIQDLKSILENADLNTDQKEYLNKIITDTFEFTQNNEWGVGLECMSDNLYEYSIPLTKGILDKIKTACKLGNLKDHYSITLEELVK